MKSSVAVFRGPNVYRPFPGVVVKFESPKGREFRFPGTERDSYFFLSSNRNKRSVTFDLFSSSGQKLLLRLLPCFDVLVENFRPSVMEDLGLGAERLLEPERRAILSGNRLYQAAVGSRMGRQQRNLLWRRTFQ